MLELRFPSLLRHNKVIRSPTVGVRTLHIVPNSPEVSFGKSRLQILLVKYLAGLGDGSVG